MKLINMDDDDNQIDLTHGNSYDNDHSHNYQNRSTKEEKTEANTHRVEHIESGSKNTYNSLDKFHVTNTATQSTLRSATPLPNHATEIKPAVVSTSPRLFTPPMVDYSSPKTTITATVTAAAAHVNSSAVSSCSVHNGSFGSAAKHVHNDNVSVQSCYSHTNSTGGINPNSSFVDTVRTNVLRNALSPVGFYNNTNTNTNTNTNINSSTIHSDGSNLSYSRNTTPPFVRRDGLTGATTPIML